MEFDVRKHKLIREYFNRDRGYHKLQLHIVTNTYVSLLKKKASAENIRIYFEEDHPSNYFHPRETREEISIQGLIDFIVTENNARTMTIGMYKPPWWNWYTRWNESPVPNKRLAGSNPAGSTRGKDDE